MQTAHGTRLFACLLLTAGLGGAAALSPIGGPHRPRKAQQDTRIRAVHTLPSRRWMGRRQVSSGSLAAALGAQCGLLLPRPPPALAAATDTMPLPKVFGKDGIVERLKTTGAPAIASWAADASLWIPRVEG